MCGFAGEFLFTSARPADVELAGRMAQRLEHRGPDESARFLSGDGRCAIGFRRLAVIDPAGSHQPMSSPDGLVTLAFNGEIYNFRKLRDELVSAGAKFRTAGDTEVLLNLYLQDDVDMLRRLRGMFAFAIYDQRKARLLLARDHLGQKPLWYAVAARTAVFASEPKALLSHPAVDAQLAIHALPAYLTMGYVPHPDSIWRGVRKLPPGHLLELPADDPAPTCYWRPRPVPPPASREQALELVRQRLAQSVSDHMVSDVPLGVLLSGGVDSAVIAALASRAAGGRIRTFTAGFDDSQFDERDDARTVAEHLHTDHTDLLIQPQAAGVLDSLVDMYDEPFADSSALPTHLICKAARQHVTVALAGDGGDEVFAGYDRYRALHLAQHMGAGTYVLLRLSATLARPFAPHSERSRLRRLLRFADALPHPYSQQYLMYRCLFRPSDLARLFTDDFAASVDLEAPAEGFLELYEQGEWADEVARAQHHDMRTYLPDDLLVKTDIASMASSLELRAPMLDPGLVSLGLGLPAEWKLDRRRGKRILKDAFGDLLPAEVFDRPKRGFGVPIARWLREEMLETLRDTLLDADLLDRGIFRKEAIVGLITDHVSGRDDHGHRLWALLILARWLGRQGR
ncbi:MAG: asparagine synthase (glutamine-hydrolyzing) [Phycisphaerae bacterium]